ncbi:cationic amino acid transporter 2-like isoform X3 [Montipora capricornis]|uniref:cationic amino acid transporter 2-like isoform X3 n=1 Tax=Montipora capricornis TaxID=246305 RepID=UPI0035F114A4
MRCFWKFWRRKWIDPASLADTKLARCLSLIDLTALGVGCTLGAGVYVIACEIARDVAGPSTVISFFIAGIASVLSGLCYAEFGARVPKAGSAYVYSYVTVGELVAFIIGWNLVMEYMIGAAAIGRAWSAYFDSMVHDKIRSWILENVGSIQMEGLGGHPDFLAAAIIIILTIIQLFGVKKSTVFIFGVTCVNIVVIVFIIIMGIILARPQYWSDFMPYGPSGVLAGSATAFFAFVGFDVIATAGEEAKNPSKSIPLSIMLALSICFFAYFGVSAAVTLIWPYNMLDYGAALPKAFEHRGAHFAKYIIAVGALCGMTAAINGGLFPLPRLLYAMASDGLIFKSFARVSKATEVPFVGTIFSGILAGFLAMIFELQALVEMMSIGTLQAYTIVSTSVLILRYQPGTIGIVSSTEGDSESSQDCRSTDLLREPTERSGKISKCIIWFLFFYFFCFSAFLINGLIPMYQGEVWAIFLVGLLVIVFIAAIVLLSLQPKSSTLLPFQVPLVPCLPLASMFINIYLMMELNPATWMRFGVWMAIGLSIYIFYGLRHSVEGKRQSEQEGYVPLQQMDSKKNDQGE